MGKRDKGQLTCIFYLPHPTSTPRHSHRASLLDEGRESKGPRQCGGSQEYETSESWWYPFLSLRPHVFPM